MYRGRLGTVPLTAPGTRTSPRQTAALLVRVPVNTIVSAAYQETDPGWGERPARALAVNRQRSRDSDPSRLRPKRAASPRRRPAMRSPPTSGRLVVRVRPEFLPPRGRRGEHRKHQLLPQGTVSNCFHQCPSKNDSAQGTDMYTLPVGGVSAPQAQGGLVPTTGLPLLSAHRVQ